MMMAKERLVEQYGAIRYTIGTGCSGGSLDPAAGRQRLPGHLPGHPAGRAASPTPGRPASSSPTTTSMRALPGEPDEVGARRRLGSARRIGRGRGPPQPRQLDRLRHGLLDRPRHAGRRLRRRSRGRQPTTPETNPDGVRCTLADYMINVFGPRPEPPWSPSSSSSATASPGFRSTTSACSTASNRAAQGAHHPGAVRRPQRQDRRRSTSTSILRPSGSQASPAGARQRLPQRRDQPGQQHGCPRDHRPPRTRPGGVPRRLPFVGGPRAAGA